MKSSILSISRALLALLFALCAASSLAQAHKIQVNDRALAAQVTAAGARLVADYGNFQVYEATSLPAELTTRSEIETRDDYNAILLNAQILDTTTAAVKAARKSVGQFSGKRLHLVHFAGPIQTSWRDELTAAGVEIVTYIPQNAYLVYGDVASLIKVQTLAGSAAHIQWEAEYLPEYKIHPAARLLDENGNPRQIGVEEFAFQLVADSIANAATLQLIDGLKLGPVRRQASVLGYVNVVVSVAPEALAQIAAQPDVLSVRPYFKRELFCERQCQIVAGNLNGNDPTGPGYLAWLASKGFTQAQFTASGFGADITDSGIDNATTAPNHAGLYVSGSRSNPSRVIYNRLEGSPNNPGSTNSGCDGHGTLNSHIVGGFNDMPLGFPHTDTAGFHFGLGVCPFVKLGSSVIFDSDFFTFPDYGNLQSRAYRDGARVSNNSWGANVNGDYDSDAQEYDALVRDAQPAGSAVPAPGNQEMVIVFANGNSGSGAQTVGTPASGKNVFSVGAAENVQPFNGSDGSGVGNSGANSANDIINFSSRGPCADGRRKPEIMAPGTHVSGGVAQAPNGGPNGTADPCFDGTGVSGGVGGSNFYPPGQELYSASSGTSHSAPGVVGGCALLRQYFINNFTNPPSPAMTKAFLMNSARYMTGTGANDNLWSNNQGMGGMNLGTAFDGIQRTLRDQLAADTFTASGQIRTFNSSIVNSNKPLRVTLAWTDAPGNTAGNAYNNNLDLTVTIGTNVYKGNVFNKDVSLTGGTSDFRNNVESVFLPAGILGEISVKVTATSLNSDGVPNNGVPVDQDFALVIYNGAMLPAGIGSSPASQTVVVGTNVTFNVTATGTTPLAYQWRYNGTNLSGATTNPLVLLNVQTNQAGGYSVIVTNAAGGATSQVATLTVLFLPPVITSQPTNIAAVVGDNVTFSAAASGALPLSYQWKFGTTELNGATSSSLTLLDVRTNQAGPYSVFISNGAGDTNSDTVTLTVTPRLPIKAWGNNDFGQATTFSVLSNAIAVAAGSFHTLALLSGGSVVAWGDNFDGQCNLPPDLTNAVSIAGGGYHSLAARADGTVAAWGAFLDGQIAVPAEATNVVAVAAGTWHSLALRADGTVVGWGDNSRGQAQVPPEATNVIAIAGGGQHSLALKADGTVLAWGNNMGSLGTGGGQVDVPWDLNQVIAIAAGDFHSLALKLNGTVVAWGDNSQAQATVPNGLTKVVGIAAGGAHSLAVHEGGLVLAWGDNLFSQSVIGANVTGVAAVAAGSYHSIALLDQFPVGPQIFTPIWQANVLNIPLPTVAGKVYFLLSKNNLTDPEWSFISGIVGNGSVRSITDPAAGVPNRFYRIQQH